MLQRYFADVGGFLPAELVYFFDFEQVFAQSLAQKFVEFRNTDFSQKLLHLHSGKNLKVRKITIIALFC